MPNSIQQLMNDGLYWMLIKLFLWTVGLSLIYAVSSSRLDNKPMSAAQVVATAGVHIFAACLILAALYLAKLLIWGLLIGPIFALHYIKIAKFIEKHRSRLLFIITRKFWLIIQVLKEK